MITFEIEIKIGIKGKRLISLGSNFSARLEYARSTNFYWIVWAIFLTTYYSTSQLVVCIYVKSILCKLSKSFSSLSGIVVRLVKSWLTFRHPSFLRCRLCKFLGNYPFNNLLPFSSSKTYSFLAFFIIVFEFFD